MNLEAVFQESLNTPSLAIVGLSFLGGVVSSFLPCTIGMMPILVGYVGGYSQDSRQEVFTQVCLFITGLALVLTVFGVGASLLGITFGAWLGSWWYYTLGVLSILLGLHLLEIIQIPVPQFLTSLPDHSQHTSPLIRRLAPLLLGIAFGMAASPCGTPFLAGILGFISSTRNAVLGGVSLFAYAIGQGVLLLAIGMFTGLVKHMAVMRHVGSVITKMSAIVFFIVGAMQIAEGAGVLSDILMALHLL